MDAATSPDWREAATPPPPHSGWNAGVLALAALLGFSSHARVRARLADIYRTTPRLRGNALLAELRPLVVGLATEAGRAFAETIGVTLAEVLRFADPACTDINLSGDISVARRLDRILGGVPLLLFDAIQETRLCWPEPSGGRCVVLRGRVLIDADLATEQILLQPHPGVVLRLFAGALVAVRSYPLIPLLDAAQAAGFERSELVAEILGESRRVAVRTPAGPLQISKEHPIATLNGRQTRLGANESEALALLARHPGQPVSRAALAEVLGLASPRALDRVMVGLRDKLGDGLITTIYGLGYLLEAKEE